MRRFDLAPDAQRLGFVSHLVAAKRLGQEVDALAPQMASGGTLAFAARLTAATAERHDINTDLLAFIKA
jgi:enoyl-CoA hydratase/carnithine racemase